MPATALMGYEVQTTGSNSGSWGSVLNVSMISYVDVNFAGVTALSLTNANVALTAAQARNQMITCTGTLSGAVVISPDSGVLWNGIRCIENLTTGAFAVSLSNGGGSVVIPQGRRALVFIDAANGPRIISIVGSSTADPVPAGSVVPFYNNAVPAGYTVVSLNDYALQIVSSSGGVTSGSVAYSTLFGRTATDSYALLIPDIPAHTHVIGTSILLMRGDGSQDHPFSPSNGGTPSSTGVQTTGGGGGHTHAIDMRVNTAALVLGTRN